MSKGLLSDIRVVDFSFGIAGPYAVELLSFMGAEVIKIESRRRLDFNRVGIDLASGKLRDIDTSPAFNYVNLNKMGVTLDLSKPKAVELALRLVAMSQVAVQSFRPGTADRMGIGYRDLCRVRPDIVMLSVSAMGATGPEAGFIGYASVFGALAGLSHLTGYPDGPPTEIRHNMDAMAATAAAVALLAGLNYRQRTGKGLHIDLSCREAITCVVGGALLDFQMNHRVRGRQANLDDGMAPHNCYRCAGDDEWISIAVATDKEWRSLCEAMGSPEWAKNAELSDSLGRWEHQEELDRNIEQWTRMYSPQQVMEMLQARGVAAVPSFKLQDFFGDPHLMERQAFQTVEHPAVGNQIVLSPPWKFSETPAEIRQSAPILGQHNKEVLHGLLGLSLDELADLETEGVIY